MWSAWCLGAGLKQSGTCPASSVVVCQQQHNDASGVAPRSGSCLRCAETHLCCVCVGGCSQFTAPEGVVLLPPKVVNCLWGLPEDQQQLMPAHPAGTLPPAAEPGATSSSSLRRVSTSGGNSSSSRCSGSVYVRYKLLPKGTYVRFQPELRSFHEVVGSDPELLKASLEACLMGYCTLSEGDWVQVRTRHSTRQQASSSDQGNPVQHALKRMRWVAIGSSVCN